MKKNILITLFLLVNTCLFAQIKNPVSWEFESEKVSNTEYKLIFRATIDKGSALYSQHIEKGGPVPTKFTFVESKDYKLLGEVEEEEENREILQDPMFEIELAKFHDEAVFTQKIKVNDNSKTINGQITFMSCNGSRCIPPKTIDFMIKLGE